MRSPKKLIFATLSLLSILGYGFFVFAAPPGPGGYNPGETLDPECNPGDIVPEPCIVISPLMTADNGLGVTGSNIQLGGRLLQATLIEQSGYDLAFTTGKVGINNSTPQFTLDIGGTSTYELSTVDFSGTLNDLVVDISTYNSVATISYNLYISDISGPDQISWYDSRGNSGSFLIDGSAQQLSYGVTTTFSNTSGHTGDESWIFTIDKIDQGTLNVSEQINLGGSYFARQNSAGSVFLGNGVDVIESITGSFFYGAGTGYNAINASYSNFMGNNAGNGAIDAFNSNFFGRDAGMDATSADSSNFIGSSSGAGASGASSSNFIGDGAGLGAIDARQSNFIGRNAGYGAIGASRSIFIGNSAGAGDKVVNGKGRWSILIGDGTSTGDDGTGLGFSNSIALGADAVNTASDQFYLTDSITQISLRKINYTLPAADGNLGDVLTTDSAGGLSWAPAGGGAGGGAGLQWYAENAAAPSVVPVATGIGSIALGDGAEALGNDMFVYGLNAGGTATNAQGSNYIGVSAGYSATNAAFSNFFGPGAGQNATNAQTSNFIGYNAGASAANAYNSNFFGYNSGQGARNAAESIFLGTSAGLNDTVNNTAPHDDISTFADTSILIGHKTSTGGFSNSIALGAYATNTATNQFMIGSGTRPINDLIISGTGSLFLPVGTDLQRTAYATDGALRYNTDQSCLEIYASSAWGCTGGGAGLQWYAEDATAPSVAPVASVNSIALGDGARALDMNMFVFGYNAGQNATSASNSNFLGNFAGYNSTYAFNSNFFGPGAGGSATNASNSSFLGNGAGNGATNAANSIFLGNSAGLSDTVNNTAAYDDITTFANTSILLGHKTSTGGFSNSIALGAYATNTAANQLQIGSTNRSISSIFIGDDKGTASKKNTFFTGSGAGVNATSANYSVFIGLDAGTSATGAALSNFLGKGAGYQATFANNSNFFGNNAGYQATNASYSNFFNGGNFATNASYSNFMGNGAGSNATNANNSNFFGKLTGAGAVNSDHSFFVGENAGGYTGTPSIVGTRNAAHSIFIGTNAGFFAADNGLDNTTNADDYSILLGNNTSTGGFENSIALGANATNTASNQFMIGSDTRPIDTTRINGSASTQCTITTGTGIACTSDERVKTNITDLTTDTLDKLLNVKTVTYNWLQNPTSKTQIGFLAQDLEQYFPELVETDSMGMKSVYYAQMTPILVEAIREMNLSITMLSDTTRESTWRDALIAWFGNATNGIENFIAGTLRARTQVCIDDVCINKEQLQSILQNNGIVNQPAPVIATPPPTDDLVIDNTTDDTVTDPDTNTNVPSEEPSVSIDDTSPTDNSEPSTTE